MPFQESRMNKKYFFAVIITLSLLSSAACYSTTGNIKNREKIVDCDADLPLDELHRCIEKEAEKYAPLFTDSNAYYSKGAILKDYTPIKRNSFKNIKKCYKKDNCIKQIASIPYRYDDLDDQFKLSLYTNPYSTNHLKIFASPLPECTEKRRCYMKELSHTFFVRYKYVEAGIEGKDFIIAKENGKKNIYAVALNAIALNKKYLIITNIIHISKLNIEEILKLKGFTYPYKIERFRSIAEKTTWEDITVAELKDMLAHEGYTPTIRDKRKPLSKNDEQKRAPSFSLNNQYTVINGYRFYTIKDSKDIKEVSISLDKREDPSKIYIKQDADVYEIDIKH